MDRRYILLLLLGAFASLAAAASAPTFCKCTCFTNSTIIEIKPHRDLPSGSSGEQSSLSSSSSPPAARAALDRRAGPSSLCSQCNRAFCLERYNLPICQGAGEKDVFTMCFQRDSRKDQIIVWTFLLGTAGLLGWAAARRVLEARGKAQAAPRRGGPGGQGGRAGVLGTGGGAGGVAGSRGGSAGRGAYSPVGEQGRTSTGSVGG